MTTSRVRALLIFFFSCLVTLNATASQRALLIGISTYANLPHLVNPRTDVTNVAEKLRSAGYKVTSVSDTGTSRDKLLETFGKFIDSVNQGDEVVVYYSGHGIEIASNNMFVPADSPKSQDVSSAYALSEKLISMRPLMDQIAERGPAMQVWIIDACRENPYSGGGRPFAVKGGLASFPDRENSFILFAANYNQIARDTLRGDPPNSKLGSPFSRTFVKLFDSWKDKGVYAFARQIRQDLVALVDPDPQLPVYIDGVLNPWCFVTCESGLRDARIFGSTGQSGRVTAAVKDPSGVTTVHFQPAPGGPENTAHYGRLVGLAPTVFMGKKSKAKECGVGQVSDLFPFGCTVLRRLSQHFDSFDPNPADAFVGETLVAQTTVNLRQGLPRATPRGATSGCVVETLAQGATAKIRSTIALSYAEDTFYWGVIDSPVLACSASREK